MNRENSCRCVKASVMITCERLQLSEDTLKGIRTVVDAFRLISVSLDLNETLNAILDALKSLINYDAAGIYVVSSETGKLRSHIVRGYLDDVGKHEPILKGEGMVGSVADSGRAILISDVKADPRYIEARTSTRSEMAVPITGSGGRLIGVLNLESDCEGYYGAVSVEVVTLFASGAAVAIEKAMLHAELMEKRRITSEIEIAKGVMQGLLPRSVPRFDGFDLAVASDPCYEVGGDYYDFIPIDAERWGITIADVSGKGIPAALLVSGLRASLHSLVRNEFALRSVFNKANGFFRESSSQSEFITLFYAEADVKTRRLIYINAGHVPPILLRKDGRRELLESGGPPIGMIDEPRYIEELIQLTKGDTLVLYTDGLMEASSDEGQEFGINGIAEAVARRREAGADEICRDVMSEVERFCGGQPADDWALVVIKSV